MDSQILMLEILQILREVCLDQQINKKKLPYRQTDLPSDMGNASDPPDPKILNPQIRWNNKVWEFKFLAILPSKRG